MIADTLQAEFYRRGWPEKYREATPKKKGEWVRLGGGGPAYVGSGGQILKACPGMKGETVKGITGESDESRGQRKARQDVADQHGVKGGEVSAEQARGLTQEHKEEAEPWTQPEEKQPKKASINPKTRFGAAVLETAQEWGVAPDDLADACQFVYEEKARQSQARESAKSHARQITGLTQRDIGRLTNAGYDYTSARHVGGPTGDKLRQFDVWSTEVARQHPGLIGNADDPNADLGAGLWDLLAEGRQVVPPIYDPGVMREAATLALANRGDTGGAPEFETAGAVPFARQGLVERYRRWMFSRENQYRRVIERFAKWEESKHPRADDGKFGEGGGDKPSPEQGKEEEPWRERLQRKNEINDKAIALLQENTERTLGVSKALTEKRLQVFREVFNHVGLGAVERFVHNVAGVTFYPTMEELTRQVVGPPPKGQAYHKKRCGGAWCPDTRRLFLDGGNDQPGASAAHASGKAPPPDGSTREYYAHEFAHAIDSGKEEEPTEDETGTYHSPSVKISDTWDWRTAWSEEITPKMAWNDTPLTKYAKEDPSEGFAEYCRLICTESTRARLDFPKCWKVWKDNGLI